MSTLETLLPALKSTNTTTTRSQMMRRLMSINSDYAREQDDRLYLQRGQGAQHVANRRRNGQSVHGAVGTPSIYAAGDEDEATYVAESDYETTSLPIRTTRRDHMRSPQRPDLSRTFSPLPSPPTEARSFSDQEYQRDPQHDVYDLAPPPGYKRLKKVGESRRQAWEDTAVEGSQFSGVRSLPFRTRARNLTFHPAQMNVKYHKAQSPFAGDGFSQDETKTRRIKRRTRSNNSSNSAGSTSRKRKRTEMSPILGSLEVVTLSQDERARKRAATAAAALASSRAVSRITAITRFFPLRPQPQVTPITT